MFENELSVVKKRGGLWLLAINNEDNLYLPHTFSLSLDIKFCNISLTSSILSRNVLAS